MTLTKRILELLGRQSPPRLIATALVLTAVIGVADYFTGAEVSWSIFYLIPTALVAWSVGRRAGGLIGLLGALTWLGANLAAGEVYSQSWIGAWNATVRFGFFFVVASLLAALKNELARERELARTDPLTGALNTRGFLEYLEHELARSARYERPLTLAYLDVDNFKTVNDQFGHLQGDALLAAIVKSCRRRLRSTDSMGRLGGDEFAFLLPETDALAARVVIEKMRDGLQDMAQEGGWPISCSIGVITITGSALGAEALVHHADELMYEVKRRGKNAALYRQVVEPAPLGTGIGRQHATGNE